MNATLTETLGRATELSLAQVWPLAALTASLDGISGDIVECGSYRCGSTIAMAAAAPSRMVYAFDTFTGMPRTTENDWHKPGDFAPSLDEVVETTAPFSNILLVRGEYKDTVPAFRCKEIALLYLDCDLYESYRLCLNHFWPMVAPGGMVVLEDMARDTCPGATKACLEFFDADVIKERFSFWVVTK